jgi:hypothetical protein
MSEDKKDQLLPPRPGEKPVKKEIKGVPLMVYINGQLIEMSKQEALGVMAQICNILIYFDQLEKENAG